MKGVGKYERGRIEGDKDSKRTKKERDREMKIRNIFTRLISTGF
jgi:hypothetical protein